MGALGLDVGVERLRSIKSNCLLVRVEVRAAHMFDDSHCCNSLERKPCSFQAKALKTAFEN